MADHEEARRGLAEAMGWKPEPFEYCPGCLVCRPCDCPDEAFHPDPLNRAQDAEALETWLVGRDTHYTRITHGQSGTRVSVYREHYCALEGDPEQRIASVVVSRNQEPDPARRRRRALVEAAWQAVQATRS